MFPKWRGVGSSTRALAASLELGAVTACATTPRATEPLTVDEVAFVSRVAELDDEAGEAALRSALGREPRVALVPSDPARPGRCRVEGVLQPDPLDDEGLQLGLRAACASDAQPPLLAFVALGRAGPLSLEAAAGRAWALLGAMRALREEGPAAWRAALAAPASATPATSLQAASADVGDPVEASVGPERHGPARAWDLDAESARAQLQAVALERLVAVRAAGTGIVLLGSAQRALEDEASPYGREVGLRAVGGLVALGDPNAVLPLIDLAQRRPPVLVRQLVYAIGALGGRHAEGYLVTVASGHPDRQVREAARRAVAELAASTRRGPAPTMTPDDPPTETTEPS